MSSINKINPVKVDNTPQKSIVHFTTNEEAWNLYSMLKACQKLKKLVTYGVLEKITVDFQRTYGPYCAIYSLDNKIENPYQFATDTLFPQQPEISIKKPKKTVSFASDTDMKVDERREKTKLSYANAVGSKGKKYFKTS